MKRLATFILATGLSSAAWAGEGTISISYDVAVKGVNVMKLGYTANLSDNTYSASLSAKTKGMANWLSDYKIEYNSGGGYGKKNVFQPSSFSRERKKSGKKSGASFAWKAGVPQLNGEDIRGLERATEAVAGGSTDPLALLLTVGFQASATPCKGKHRVFDGRDVMDVSLSGDGTSCKLTAKTIAGKTYENAENKNDLVDTYTVVFKDTEVPFLNRTIKVPVEISGRASAQNFIATVNDIDVSGSATN